MSGDRAHSAAAHAMLTVESPTVRATAIAAARAALAPIRELHQKGDRCKCCSGRDADGSLIARHVCTGCPSGYPHYVHWPCATAKFCYSEEELR